jgi:hypothetical protein
LENTRYVRIAYAELGDGPHLAGDPGRQDLAVLLFAKSRAREIAAGNKGHDVQHNLVFTQDGVHNHRHDRTEVGFPSDLYQGHHQTSSLENSTIAKNEAQYQHDLTVATDRMVLLTFLPSQYSDDTSQWCFRYPWGNG